MTWHTPTRPPGVFIRKIIRAMGQIGQDDLNIMIATINDVSCSDNVAQVLNHGTLEGMASMYFVDWPLFDYSLAQYLHAPHSIASTTRMPSLTDPRTGSTEIARQIANGLSYLHKKHRLHGRLKPTNGTSYSLARAYRSPVLKKGYALETHRLWTCTPCQ